MSVLSQYFSLLEQLLSEFPACYVHGCPVHQAMWVGSLQIREQQNLFELAGVTRVVNCASNVQFPEGMSYQVAAVGVVVVVVVVIVMEAVLGE